MSTLPGIRVKNSRFQTPSDIRIVPVVSRGGILLGLDVAQFLTGMLAGIIGDSGVMDGAASIYQYSRIQRKSKDRLTLCSLQRRYPCSWTL